MGAPGIQTLIARMARNADTLGICGKMKLSNYVFLILLVGIMVYGRYHRTNSYPFRKGYSE